jgi:hypothetical protein
MAGAAAESELRFLDAVPRAGARFAELSEVGVGDELLARVGAIEDRGSPHEHLIRLG